LTKRVLAVGSISGPDLTIHIRVAVRPVEELLKEISNKNRESGAEMQFPEYTKDTTNKGKDPNHVQL